MMRGGRRLRILLIMLLVLLVLLVVLAFCSRREVPVAPSSSSERSHAPSSPRTVRPAQYPVYQGCWTMDFAPIVSIRLYRDPESGLPVADVAYGAKEDTTNIEWRRDPLSFAGLEKKDFVVEWAPPVLTLTHSITSVEEWAWFNAKHFPYGGLDQVLTYEGDKATLTVGDMAGRLVEEGTAVRYRVTFRKAEGEDEYGAFAAYDPGYPPLVVASVVYWPSTRVFTLGAQEFETRVLANVDGDEAFADPAASGWVVTDGRMRPILDGRAVNFRRISLQDANGQPLEDLPRGEPVTLVAEAASHCPYAQETARLEVIAENFSAFDDDHPWEQRFVEFTESDPTSGLFVTQRAVVLDWPVIVLFEGESRPMLRLVPEGLGSGIAEQAGRVFRVPYAVKEGS